MKYILFAIFLSGCAASNPPGVAMSEAEAKACEAQGCSVWTEAELRELVEKAAAQAHGMFLADLDTHGCLRGRT